MTRYMVYRATDGSEWAAEIRRSRQGSYQVIVRYPPGEDLYPSLAYQGDDAGAAHAAALECGRGWERRGFVRVLP